jgi:hypothetical protein
MTLTLDVSRLAFEGLSDVRIAEQTNSSIETVRKLVARGKARHCGGHRNDMPKYGFLVRLPRPCIEVLIREAGARLCGPTDLAERILAMVLTDNLIDAVIDEGRGEGSNG